MSHRYRLYPDPSQEEILLRHCWDSRAVWNMALEQCGHARRVGQYADQGAWDRQLSEARQWSPELAEGSSSVQQAALRDLRQAFRNWWANPGHFRHPTWRSAKKGHWGFMVRDLTVRKLNRRWAEITVPKAGKVLFRLTRPIPVDAKTARVTRDRSGRWHVSIVAVPDQIKGPDSGEIVGIDRGVAVSFQCSDGRSWNTPTLNPHEQRRLRLLQRGESNDFSRWRMSRLSSWGTPSAPPTHSGMRPTPGVDRTIRERVVPINKTFVELERAKLIDAIGGTCVGGEWFAFHDPRERDAAKSLIDMLCPALRCRTHGNVMLHVTVEPEAAAASHAA